MVDGSVALTLRIVYKNDNNVDNSPAQREFWPTNTTALQLMFSCLNVT
jgi:hypothetical protein